MAKRGRKRKTERKGYFYEEQENAVIEFIKTTDEKKKNKIFYEVLRPAFTKMIESIIRRYNLYPPDEIFEETFDDTLSFLFTKIDKFNPDSGYKAYSYCGTICKNYLIAKINQFAKSQKRNYSLEEAPVNVEEINDDNVQPMDNEEDFLTKLINETSKKIQEMLNSRTQFRLNDNEVKIGNALIVFFRDWEDEFLEMGSNKFNKSSILLYLKENTLLNTKEIRDAMKKYKIVYYDIKKKLLSE